MRQSPKLAGGAVLASIVSLFTTTASAQPPSAAASGRFPVVIVVPRCVKAPPGDLQLARQRMKEVENG